MTLKLLVQEISYRTRNIVSLIFLFKKKNTARNKRVNRLNRKTMCLHLKIRAASLFPR